MNSEEFNPHSDYAAVSNAFRIGLALTEFCLDWGTDDRHGQVWLESSITGFSNRAIVMYSPHIEGFRKRFVFLKGADTKAVASNLLEVYLGYRDPKPEEVL